MRTYLLKRLLLVVPTMLGITLITFLVMQFAPGDPAEMKVSPGAGGQQQNEQINRETYDRLRERFDLDKPKVMQYVRWLGRLCGLRVEVSSKKQECRDEVKAERLRLYRRDNAAAIEARRAQTEKDIRADLADDLARWRAGGADGLRAAAGRLGLSLRPEAELEAQLRARLEPLLAVELERQHAAWVEGQAEQHHYPKETDAVRARYVQAHGKDFEQVFEYEGLRLNTTESGMWRPLDFGKSFNDDRDVLDKMLEKLPVTIEISLLSIIFAYLIAIPLGIHSAVSKGSAADQFITTLLFILYSLPSFWVAIMLLLLVSHGGIASETWQIFPVSGVPDLLGERGGRTAFAHLWLHCEHLVLPVFCSTYGSFAYLSRQMRAGMLDVIRSDYIRTARAKGLGERVVIFKHALRNSMIPILTIIAVILPALVGGSVIIEAIFNIDGVGLLTFEAIQNRDYPIVMATFTLSAILTLLGILLSDLLYAVVDPRINFEGK